MKPGDRIGKYTLEQMLGQGGMAEVWAGRIEGPADFVKPVALKFILPSYSNDAEYGRLFFNEAKLAAEIQHSNLVSIIDFAQVPADAPPELAGRYFIAMERVDGRNLDEVHALSQRRGTPLPPEIAVHIMSEVLIALRYIHERERLTRRTALVHRDVSPQNVLLSFAGEVKLSDFGIAKAVSAHVTTAGVRGKLGYTAPEILSGAPASHQTDQFAAGIVLWELLSGRRLFAGSHPAEILEKIRTGYVPAPERRGGHMPAGLDKVVLRMLAHRREDRFPSTAAALDALHSLTRGMGAGAIRLSELMLSLYEGARTNTAPVSGTAVITRPTTVLPQVGPTATTAAAATALPVGDGSTRTLPPSAFPGMAWPPKAFHADGIPVNRSSPGGISLDGAGTIPRRQTSRPRDPSFSLEIERQRQATAYQRFEHAVRFESFPGSIDDWFWQHVKTGRDIFTDTPLPPDAEIVIGWPRLARVGWRDTLLLAWNGTYPWGADGYWVVEDPTTDQMMALFPQALERQAFQSVAREQWRRWWLEREVDPDGELPGGKMIPVSERARRLMRPGSKPPTTGDEWSQLLRGEHAREDRETLRRLKQIDVAARPVASVNSSWWKRLRWASSVTGPAPQEQKRVDQKGTDKGAE